MLSTGNLIYVHDGGESSSDYFEYTLSDGNTTLAGNYGFVINPVNDAPVMSTNTGLTVLEGSTTVLSSANLSVTDSDSGETVLGYYLSTNVTNGSLVLSGASGSGNFTMGDLTSGNLSYVHDGGESTSDSFSFDVLDGSGGNLASQTFDIVITPVDDAPTFSANTSMHLDEGATAIVGSANLAVSDVDTANSSLNFTITSNVSYGTLSVNVASSGSGNFTMTELLSTGNLIYVHDGGESSSDYFEYTLSDGNTTLSGNYGFIINPVNDAPTMSTNTGVTVGEGSTVLIPSGNLAVSDSDSGETVLGFYLSSNVSHGALVRTGASGSGNFTMGDISSGNLSYVHDGGESTSDSFTFDVLDGSGGNLASQTFSITITPGDDAPTISANTGMTLTEGNTVVISSSNLAFTDVDTVNSSLNFTITSNVNYGTLSVNVASSGSGNFTMTELLSTGNLIYVHDGSETTSDYFAYNLSDGTTSLSGNFAFTITPVNDVPSLSANTGISVIEGSTVVIPSANLFALDADNTDSEVAFYLSSNTVNGQLVLSGSPSSGNFTMADLVASNLSYVHDGSETTSDSFSFDVLDGVGGNLSNQTFSITVIPSDDAPVISANTNMSLNEGDSVVISSSNLAFSDVDTSDSDLNFTITSNVSYGTLSVNVASSGSGYFTMTELLSEGNVIYTHDGSESLSDYFAYTLSDGSNSISGNFSFSISPVNDSPALSTNTTLSVDEGTSVVITSSNLLVTDPDNSETELSFYISSNVSNGELSLAAAPASGNFTMGDISSGNLSYTHDGSESPGSDSFTFVVLDGVGGNSMTQTFHLSITPVDDAPVLSSNTGIVINEGDSVLISSANLAYTDVDSSDSALSFTISSNVANGTLSVNAASSGSGYFTMTELLSQGNLVYTHDSSETTSDVFNYQLSDGTTQLSGEFSITVIPVNDAPSITVNTGLTLLEGDSATITTSEFSAEDPDHADSEVVFTMVSTVSQGNLSLSGNILTASDNFTQADLVAGSLSYAHNDTETTSDSFVVTIDDGEAGASSNVTFNFSITPVNEAPSISGTAGLSATAGAAYSFTPSATDPDNGDTLSFSFVSTPSISSWASINTNTGELSGTPTTGDDGTYTVTITVTDSGSLSDSLASFDLVVNDGVNPTASFSPSEGSTEVDPRSTIVVTFDEAMYYNGELLSDDDLSSISMSLKDGAGAGNSMSFTASVSSDSTTVTIDPDFIFNPSANIVFSIDATAITDVGLLAGQLESVNFVSASLSGDLPEIEEASIAQTILRQESRATLNLRSTQIPSVDEVEYFWIDASDGTVLKTDIVSLSEAIDGSSVYFDLAGSSLSKGDSLQAILVPIADDLPYYPFATVARTISNTAPEAATSLSYSPSQPPLESVDLDLSVIGASDVDGDSITYNYDWFLNGSALLSDSGSSPYTLSSSQFSDGDQLKVTVTPTDGTDSGLPSSIYLTIGANAPIASISANVSEVFADQIFELDASGSQATESNSSITRYDFDWTGDSIADASESSGDSDFDGIVSLSLSKGSHTATVTVTDSNSVQSMASINIEVSNSAPVIDSISFSASYIDVTADLSVVLSSSDIDGDTVTYSYRWFINDTEHSETSDTMNSGLLTKGDKVTVMVTPNDGTEDGATRSLLTTVENAVPVIGSVSISPSSPSESDDISAIHDTPSDADGDSLTVNYVWYKDEVVQTSQTTSSVSDDATSFGDVWRVEVTADDGTDSITSQSGNIGVGNVAPVINNISVSQFSGMYSDDISVLVSAFDFEGDDLTYSYDFNNDGTVDLVSSSENVTWNFVKGTYNISVAVSDGISTDEALSSFQMFISNTAPVANAGVDLTVNINSTVTIAGNASDVDVEDVDALTYSWTVISSSTTDPTLSGTSSSEVSFATTQAATYVLQLTVSDGNASHVDTVNITVSDLFAVTATGQSLSSAAETTLISSLQSLDYSDDQDVAEALNLIFSNVQSGVSDSVRNTVLSSLMSILDNIAAGSDLGTDADLMVKSLDLLLPVNDANKPALDEDDIDNMLDIIEDLGDAVLSQTQVSQSFGFITDLVVDQGNSEDLSAESLRRTGVVSKKLVENLVRNALDFGSISKPGEGTTYTYSDANDQISVMAIPLSLSNVTSDVVLEDGTNAIVTLPQIFANNNGKELALSITRYNFNINRQNGESSNDDPYSSVYSIDLINTDGSVEAISNLNEDNQLSITLSYDPSLFTYEHRALATYFSESSSTWEMDGITIEDIDTSNNQVTFKVSHLTDFSIFEDTRAEDGLSGGGGGCLLK